MAVPDRTVAAIIPCKDEADRIAATVARRARPSTGSTASSSSTTAAPTARQPSPTRPAPSVVVHARNAGKAAALETGVRHLRGLEAADGHAPRHLLFVDGDLEESATNLHVLLPPVLEGRADMTIATLPAAEGRRRRPRLRRAPRPRRHRRGLTGWTPVQPLSGMRCLTAEAFEAASPLAPGWGVEVGLTVDVLTAGLRVEEVPCELQHRVSGQGLARTGAPRQAVPRRLARPHPAPPAPGPLRACTRCRSPPLTAAVAPRPAARARRRRPAHAASSSPRSPCSSSSG